MRTKASALKIKRMYLGFTLAELLVVITILGILATIAIIGYSNYIGGSRDSSRIAQMKSINDSLNIHGTRKTLSLPEDYTTVTASGTTISYQGYIGSEILEEINYKDGGRDPLDQAYYTYYLASDRQNFQLLGFLEKQENLEISLIPQTYASDYSKRFPKVYGKKLGVITDPSTNTPLQDLGISEDGFDIINTTDIYTAHITDSVSFSGTGGALIPSLWNSSCKRISESGSFKGSKNYITIVDGVPTETYCDQDSL